MKFISNKGNLENSKKVKKSSNILRKDTDDNDILLSDAPKNVSENDDAGVIKPLDVEEPESSGENEIPEKSDSVLNPPEKIVWEEYYLSGYCKNKDDSEYYARSSDNTEIYNISPEGLKIYACQKNDKNEIIQVPAKTKNSVPLYIEDEKGVIKYPLNLTKGETIFPLKENTNEPTYLRNSLGQEVYPQHPPFYIRDNQGNVIFIKISELPTYAKSLEGSEVYPTDLNSGSEFYIKIRDEEIGARKNDGSFYYAKRKNSSEFYPKRFCTIEN